MHLLLLKIGKWFLSKAFLYLLVGALLVAGFALWLYARANIASEENRQRSFEALEARAGQVYEALNEAHARMLEIGEEIASTRQRIESANQAIKLLDGFLEKVERLIFLSEEERADSERQLAEAKAEREAESARLSLLVKEQTDLRVSRVVLTEEAKTLELELARLEGSKSEFVIYLGDAWDQLKVYLLVALASVVMLPIVWKLFSYYLWASVLMRMGAMRLCKEELPMPSLLASGVSAQIDLEDRNRLWVKESYLQASDESLKRKTRFVLDWKIPFTCVAAGLIEMVELASADRSGKVTVSPQKRAELEVALIDIPKEGKLVARPSCIAGILSLEGETVGIRRRWKLLHPQSWMTFQFRYFEFQGPCQLVVSGVRGVRIETMDTSNEEGRRANQVATLGFTPNLRYGVARAETFWTYLRGFNPLFDDVFRGKGAFLCQEITDAETTTAARFWSGIWNSMLKILGV